MDRALGVFGGGGPGLPDHALVSEWLWRFGVALAVAAVGFWLSKVLSRAVDRVLIFHNGRIREELAGDAISRRRLRNLG